MATTFKGSWQQNVHYYVDDLVMVESGGLGYRSGNIIRCTIEHTSGNILDMQYWENWQQPASSPDPVSASGINFPYLILDLL